MTDQGRGYGAAPWGHGDPNQGSPYAGSVGYPQQPSGWGDPQAQDPYGTGQYPVQQPVPQPGYPQQGGPQQQGYPQQGYPQQGYPQQQHPQQARPQQPYRQPPTPPARPAAPVLGPDGIDWEAEAAALDAEQHAPVEELPAEDEGPAEEYSDEYPEDHGDGYDEEEDYQPFLAAEDDTRSGERRRKQQGRTERKRSGVACLGMSMLLVAAIGAGGYYGYGFYKNHFGPPADFTGGGTGSVTVTIPSGADGWAMANVLKADDVVKSGQAFVNAYNKNAKATTIQPGSYTLKREMSGADAVALLIADNGGDVMTVTEGMRASAVYTKIDAKLGLPAGTTAKAAKDNISALGLPAYANGDIEGFLWPTRYSVTKGMKPADLLKQMVANTVAQFQGLGMDSGASAVKLKSGYQVLIEASILQAEGNNSADFSKIARVLSNRINETDGETHGQLQLDTTLQYALNSTKFTNAQKDGDKAGGYNTYLVKGLPPGPISNPGAAAINAVLNPAPGSWLYFIAMSPTNTQFANTFTDFKVLVKQYCTAHNQGFNASAGQCD
ncbi:endolytic transglycosylase MltG [Streptacidiphilus carbonis]|uniref:endolytic transglycosylase MltG n=1 Tax=Streptacidiphilus carbonis TaxID=105422 RepID=UPI000693A805|nr:endolytic transglycosylase MltG [Streptacidiphilus carbonis]